MILIILFIIVSFISIIAIIRSGKSPRHVFTEIKFELIYQVLGGRSLIEDILLKKKNKTELPNKTGQNAIVTGGSRGIGVEIVKMLLQCDMNVIIACRNVQAGEKLETIIRKDGIKTGELKVFECDTGSIKSVKAFCSKIKEKYSKINILVNNAGIMFTPYEETVDEFESQFAVNYLGHFLMCHLLMPLLVAGGNEDKINSRIVNVSSIAHMAGDINFDDINNKQQYITSQTYAQSKLAQVLFTLYLQKLFEEKKLPIQIHSVHPGICDTGLFDGTPIKNMFPWLPKLLFKTSIAGAIPIVYAAVSPKLENRGGVYISNCRVTNVATKALSLDLQKRFFHFTEQLLEIPHFGSIEIM